MAVPAMLQIDDWYLRAAPSEQVTEEQGCFIPATHNTFVSVRVASAADPQWRNTVTGALATACAGRTVVVAVTFTKTSANKAIRNTLNWRDGQSVMAHLLLTLTPKSLPVGDAKGWSELRTAAATDIRRFSCHKRGGVYVQPANLDAGKIVRHEDIASWAGDTKFVIFTRDAAEMARVVPRDQLHRLTTIMRGTLTYSRNRATEPMGSWWSPSRCEATRHRSAHTFLRAHSASPQTAILHLPERPPDYVLTISCTRLIRPRQTLHGLR